MGATDPSVPPGSSGWDALERRHKAAVVAGATAAVLAVTAGVAAWAIWGRSSPAEQDVAITPSKPTSAPAGAPSADASETSTAADGASTREATGSAHATGTPAFLRAPYVAYRIGGELWVAREDGASARRVTSTDSEAYALSPDARTVAVAEWPGVLRLVDVDSGSSVSVAGAIGEAPSWSPASRWLAFTSAVRGGRFEVRRVERGGGRAETLASGAMPSVSTDGARIAFVRSGLPGLGDPLAVLDVAKETTTAVPRARGVTDHVWSGPRSLCFATTGPGLEDVAVWSYALGDREAVKLAVASPEARPHVYSALCPSPDGSALLFAEVGDDGYSRMFVVRGGAGAARPIVTRRDAYPVCWTADGTRVLFFEGNTLQGEPTRLVSALPDGTGRRVVAEGARR